ncbi:hypothetical protein Tco_0348516 [Tanacetum coccineum]
MQSPPCWSVCSQATSASVVALCRDCRSPANANAAKNQRGVLGKPIASLGIAKLSWQLVGVGDEMVMDLEGSYSVTWVGDMGTNPDSNVVTGTFLLNNRYAYILFNTGADGSFVSTAFSSQIVITPTTLDHYYDVELADGKIIRINTIIRGCRLNFLNHPFNIDLMPIELGSFDVIIENRLYSLGNETLIVRGDGSNQGNETRLKTSSRALKRRNFPKVFLEDLPGLPPTRQVNFRIDLMLVLPTEHEPPYDYSSNLNEGRGIVRPTPGAF